MSRRYRHLIFAVVAIVLGAACNSSTTETHSAHQHPAGEVYTCPMHPEIIRDQPGSCPICGMDLVKKETASKAVEDVALDMLLRPANEFVVSGVPVTTIEEREEDLSLNVVGVVGYDTRQIGTVASRVAGRIERLHLRYKYQPVSKGQKIMDIYSTGLLTAQQNLLFLLKNDPENTSLIEAAKSKLALLGMSRGEIDHVVETGTPKCAVAIFSIYSGFITDMAAMQTPAAADGMAPAVQSPQELLVKEGMYVEAGQAVFNVYDASRAWVLLDIFAEHQNMVQAGSIVKIVPETAPHESFQARLDYIEPVFRPGNKTLTARAYFNNSKMKLPIGARVNATIFSKAANAGWLPKTSVLSLGHDKIVFLKEGGGFAAKKVTTGKEANDHIEISGGLTSTDSVAVNAQYLVDNEAFIKVKQ